MAIEDYIQGDYIKNLLDAKKEGKDYFKPKDPHFYKKMGFLILLLIGLVLGCYFVIRYIDGL